MHNKRNIIAQCEAKMLELEEYNNQLLEAVEKTKELKDWSKATETRLRDLYSFKNKSQEERVKENICIQEDCKKQLRQVIELEEAYNKLLPGRTTSLVLSILT